MKVLNNKRGVLKLVFWASLISLYGNIAFCKDILKLSTQGQRWACCEIEKIYVSPNRSVAGAVIIEGENKLGHSGCGNPMNRNGYGTWGFFGGNQDGGVPSSVWYDVYGVKGKQYISIRYCKDGDPESSIRVSINGVDQGISFTPQNLNPNPPEEDWGKGWFRFATSGWYEVNFPDSCQLSVKNNTIDNPVPASGGNYSFKVILDGGCDENNWSITSKPEWISLSPSSGSSSATVDVKIFDNQNSNSSRTGTIIIESENSINSPIAITVNQRGPCNLTINNNTIPNPVSASGGNYSFRVNLDGDCDENNWSIASKPSWISLNPSSGSSSQSVDISVSSNSGSYSRTGTIIIESDNSNGSPKTITVNQREKCQLSLSGITVPSVVPATVDIRYEFYVSTNCSGGWFSNSNPWITLKPENGTSNQKVEVIISDNGYFVRNGIISIKSLETGQEKSIQFVQLAKTDSIPPDSSNNYSYAVNIVTNNSLPKPLAINPELIPMKEDNYEIGVSFIPVSLAKLQKALNSSTKNLNWSIDEYPTWMQLEPTAGDSSAVINIAVEANDTGPNRFGSIVVNAPGAIDSIQAIHFCQSGIYESILNKIVITPKNAKINIGDSLRFITRGFDQNDNIMSNLNFKYSATGGTIIQEKDSSVSITHKDSYSAIYILNKPGSQIVVCTDSASGIADTAYVNYQGSCDLTIKNNTIPNPVPTSGGDYSFKVNLDGDCISGWNSTFNSWITLNPQSGTTNQKVEVIVSKNDSLQRNGTIIIKSLETDQEKYINFIQLAKTDTVPPNYFYALNIVTDNSLQNPLPVIPDTIPKDRASYRIGVSFNLVGLLKFKEVLNSSTKNLQWSIDEYPSWIQLEPTEGDSNAVINIAVEANETGPNRLGSILVKAPSAINSIQTVHFCQAGIYKSVLNKITLTPANIIMNVGDSIRFTAKGFDQNNNPMSNLDFKYSATGGTIIQEKDSFIPITHRDDCSAVYILNKSGSQIVVCVDNVSGIADTAYINQSVLNIIDVFPDEVNLEVDETQQFIAKGYDNNGDEVSIKPTWAATGGIITSTGLYTALDQGEFTITSSSKGISDTAKVYVQETLVLNNYKRPTKFQLFQNYPNPFNPETAIKFNVKKKCYVRLDIYDIQGKWNNTLVGSILDSGEYEVVFNAASLPTGIYYYKIDMQGFVDIKKMVLLK